MKHRIRSHSTDDTCRQPSTHTSHHTISNTHTHGHTIKADAASSPYQQTDRKMRENFSFSVFATKHEHSEKQIQEADKV